ncbi:MAG: restriction endonuclease subunit S [Candidatus Jacksonbacteria bacterium]
MPTFKKVKLKEICEKVDYGFTASASKINIGPKFLRITDIAHSSIDWDSVPYCEISETEKGKYLLTDGDIVVARTGATTGYAKCLKDLPEAVFASYLVRFRINEENNNRFIGHVIESQDYKDFIKKNLGGSAQPQANAQILGSYELSLPDKETQTRIASVLSAYDDLIENNEKRIKALEQMAQLLYTEWFVKFTVPAEVLTKEGELPEGWEIVKIGDLLKNVKRKVKLQTNEYRAAGLYPIVDQGRDFIAGYTDNEDAIYNENLIVFGDHSRCFKYCNFHFACGADGTQLLKTNDFEKMPQILLYYSVINASLQNYSYARHFKFLKALNILKPDSATANAFDKLVSQSYEQIKKLRQQNQNLSKTRDLLIPQLVTGKRELK